MGLGIECRLFDNNDGGLSDDFYLSDSDDFEVFVIFFDVDYDYDDIVVLFMLRCFVLCGG